MNATMTEIFFQQNKEVMPAMAQWKDTIQTVMRGCSNEEYAKKTIASSLDWLSDHTRQELWRTLANGK